MAIKLPDLPYGKGALAPYISKETLEFHHDKHHAGYVKKTNKAIDGTDLENATLEEIVRAAAERGDQSLFNNAAQVWNHTFYWNSMTPKGGGAPTGDIAALIKDAFGAADGFKEEFAAAGAGQFGSGWAWLILKDGKLEVAKTANAETPLTDPDATPLLTMDVWEHAYYLDYQNKRPAYIDAFIDHLVNWDFANGNLRKA